jgi:hypothetical protein
MSQDQSQQINQQPSNQMNSQLNPNNAFSNPHSQNSINFFPNSLYANFNQNQYFNQRSIEPSTLFPQINQGNYVWPQMLQSSQPQRFINGSYLMPGNQFVPNYKIPQNQNFFM